MRSHSEEGEWSLDKLKPIKIHFKTQEEDEKGLFTLMVSGMPVQSLSHNDIL